MAESFSHRQSLVDAATVLAARRAIDREIAQLVADPFDTEAAHRLQNAVDANAARAQQALSRLGDVSTELREPWEAPVASPKVPGASSDDEVAPLNLSSYRTIVSTREEPSP